MNAKEAIVRFLDENGLNQWTERFEQFYEFSCEKDYDEELSKNVIANVSLKHRLAKWIVHDIMLGEGKFLVEREICDYRFYSMILYYLWTFVLNKPEMDIYDAKEMLTCFQTEIHVGKGIYLDGVTISSSDRLSPVIMKSGGDFHPSYRNFIVNMLCFASDKFVLGCRCDSGCVNSMRYHKGCKPLGQRLDSHGRKWTVFMIDRTLSDDFTAIFSNLLDGDGTLEVCDWIADNDVRVIYRQNF
jgi:hypothetical protein